jgi:hypothetical protein
MGLTAVFDSSVLISMIDHENTIEGVKSNLVYQLFNKNGVEIVYTKDIKDEVLRKSSDRMNVFLNSQNLIPYFIGIKTWDVINAEWKDIGSDFDDDGKGYIDIKNYLNLSKRSLDDTILNDTVNNGVDIFVHRNTNDFKKLPLDFWQKNKVLNIDLEIIEINEVESDLNRIINEKRVKGDIK